MRPRSFPIAFALLFLLVIAIASHGFGPVGWWGGFWILPRLLFPFLIVAAVLCLTRSRFAWSGAHGWSAGLVEQSSGPTPAYHAKSPEEVLRERFARGEITRDEYHESVVDMLKDRYVRDELTLEEYEARVGVVMGEGQAARGESPRGAEKAPDQEGDR